jgi:hypothetical protein
MVLFITIDKFDSNPMLVNINKLKLYKIIENQTLQLVLVKLSDLVTDEFVQTKELNSLFVELEGFQVVEFELVCNYLTLGHIKSIDVIVHHYFITTNCYEPATNKWRITRQDKFY